MRLLAAIHPVAPPPSPDGSLAGWVWFGLALAIVVAAGLLIASRR